LNNQELILATPEAKHNLPLLPLQRGTRKEVSVVRINQGAGRRVHGAKYKR
jgi:hypothetical protein